MKLKKMLCILGVVATLCCGNAVAQPAYFHPNGCYYELVSRPVDAITAFYQASNRKHNGRKGQLAPIYSKEVLQFLSETFGSQLHLTWIGGYQMPGAQEPGGGWVWTTGHPVCFAPWHSDQPNNLRGRDDTLILSWRAPRGLGFSDTHRSRVANGYIVVYPPKRTQGLALITPGGYPLWCFDKVLSGFPVQAQQYGLAGDKFLAGEPLAPYQDGNPEIHAVRGNTIHTLINDRNGEFSGRGVATSYIWSFRPNERSLVMDLDGDRTSELIRYRPHSYPTYTRATVYLDKNHDMQYSSSDPRTRWDIQLSSRDMLLGGHLRNNWRWDELAIWRDSTGHWELYTTHNGAPTTQVFARPQFGLSGDLPTLADVNGDGVADLVVYRPSTGIAYINVYEAGDPEGGYNTWGDVDLTVDYSMWLGIMNSHFQWTNAQWNRAVVPAG